jgi:hypothetical protein
MIRAGMASSTSICSSSGTTSLRMNVRTADSTSVRSEGSTSISPVARYPEQR